MLTSGVWRIDQVALTRMVGVAPRVFLRLSRDGVLVAECDTLAELQAVLERTVGAPELADFAPPAAADPEPGWGYTLTTKARTLSRRAGRSKI